MLFHRVPDLARIGSRDAIHDLSVLLQHDEGNLCNVVVLADLADLLGVQTKEGDALWVGGGVCAGEGGQDGAHLLARLGPWRVEVDDSEAVGGEFGDVVGEVALGRNGCDCAGGSHFGGS